MEDTFSRFTCNVIVNKFKNSDNNNKSRKKREREKKKLQQ